MDNSKGRQAINSWGIFLIDDIKSPQRNSIAMGPFGSNIKKENFQAEGIPVIRGNNLKNSKFVDCNFVYISDKLANQLSASLARRLDIILTHRGTIGQVAIIPPNSKFNTYIVSQSQMKLTLDQTKCDPYFVYYFLRSEFGISQFLSNSSQTGVPAIASPTTALKSIKIPLPPLNKQKAIAKILFDLDSKIELNQKMNKTLEAIAQAIFKHWFIDFEFPNEKGKPYKSSGGEMVDSELGEIPNGWEVTILGFHTNFKKGKKPVEINSNEDPNLIPIISMEMLEGGHPNLGSPLGMNIASKYDPVMVMDGASSGRIEIGFEGIIGSTFASVTTTSDKVSNFYLYHTLKVIEHEIRNNPTGTSIPHADKSKINKMKLLIPDRKVLQLFDEFIRVSIETIVKNRKEIIILAEIKNLVLPRLISGKIRIPLEE